MVVLNHLSQMFKTNKNCILATNFIFIYVLCIYFFTFKDINLSNHLVFSNTLESGQLAIIITLNNDTVIYSP